MLRALEFPKCRETIVVFEIPQTKRGFWDTSYGGPGALNWYHYHQFHWNWLECQIRILMLLLSLILRVNVTSQFVYTWKKIAIVELFGFEFYLKLTSFVSIVPIIVANHICWQYEQIDWALEEYSTKFRLLCYCTSTVLCGLDFVSLTSRNTYNMCFISIIVSSITLLLLQYFAIKSSFQQEV